MFDGGKMNINERALSLVVKMATRRQALAGIGIAFGSLAATSTVWGRAQGQETGGPMKITPGSAASRDRTSLHEETSLKAAPQRIYEALLDSKQFAAFSGAPAEIDPKAGGAFSMFGGMIVGRNIELVSNQRIVQAWRPTHWEPGFYSIVKFELKPQGPETILVLDHRGFPEGEYDSLTSGWNEHYWERLKKFLG
jgi:activator of HSP90 ATPase